MKNVKNLVLAVVAVAAIAVGVVGWWQYVDLTTAKGADNQALVNAKNTSTAQSEVSQALEKVLSYDYNDPKTTQQAAEKLLSGDARKEYDTLFEALQKQAPGQKLVLTAKVSAAGVKELSDRKATLLVFVDQSARRAGDEQANVSAAQLAITARKGSTGGWTITGLQPL